ncbi:hypothetical protein [Mucilaginibacter ginsenosidivorax]|uniref:Uncharacterized protein n=1 Tax=Mucilaginibacter ginsenosidivorax TaxID=862126 RepID=A0A5B8VSJ7_9SPHI|nr:hypothetical protein [Mucilaginibacter ginsenosidivorax]QEC74420.1 hypothetical protein FSB76_00065 [Mucilaginibacter ginsenosidivorax]
MPENIFCAGSPINGIGFLSPWSAPSRPITQITKSATRTTQSIAAPNEKPTEKSIAPAAYDTIIDTMWNSSVCLI